ncbi:DUF3152 domain-containing protein, partial [Brachybacterium sp. 107]|uniref:DUF3152 domain-containing protein n=1 Tax=Brachybacterium sp. 107 TaxID=3457736 RepID=UPI004034C908
LSALVLIVIVLLLVAVAAGIRALAADAARTDSAAESLVAEQTRAVDEGADDGNEDKDKDDDGNQDEDDQEIVRTDTVGTGTWTFSLPDLDTDDVDADSDDPEDPTTHTYAVRVEGGIDLDADEVAQEIASVLDDARGWRSVDEVAFAQVEDPATAEFTISIASPPTVDELCLPAHTNGRWSCRVGQDVVLNSDRWLHRTPTFSDTAEYRAYMINHEVGHFLGHDHETCGGEGLTAPVMLQQSIDLGGCRPNAWPSTDDQAAGSGDG